MQILLIPQVRTQDKIWYEIEHDLIKVSMSGKTDIFDFSVFPDGELKFYDDEGNLLMQTIFEETPILNAKREQGELFVEILFSIDMDEEDNRLLFPEWMSLEAFKKLMQEIVIRKNEKQIVETRRDLERER